MYKKRSNVMESANVYYSVEIGDNEDFFDVIEYPFCMDVEQVLQNAIKEIKKQIDITKIDKIKIVLKKHNIQG
jgi:hypothetical protein